MILWELFVCQAFLVSSLFSGTVLVMSWNGQMPKHVKGKKNISIVEDLSIRFGRGFSFSGRGSFFGAKCIGTGRGRDVSGILDP